MSFLKMNMDLQGTFIIEHCALLKSKRMVYYDTTG